MRPRQDCVGRLCDAQAVARPADTLILSPEGGSASYEDLGRQVRQVVAVLRAQGVSRQDRVAIVLPDGPELALGFLAVAAGTICAPTNPRMSRDEFQFYFQDLKAAAVIVAEGTPQVAREVAAELGIAVWELVPAPENPPVENSPLFKLYRDGVELVAGDETGSDPDCSGPDYSGPNDVAMILYTSGTTSKPKAVLLRHASLCAAARNMVGNLGLTSADRCLNVMPQFHLHGLSTILNTLTAGGSMVCARGFEASRFFGWLEEFSPTWYSAVPTIHQAVLERASGEYASRAREVLARHPLRFIRSTSAAIAPQLLERLEATLGAPVIEAYAMTEAASQITSNQLPPAVRKTGSVGRATGPEVGILQESGSELLPPRALGEIAIRGEMIVAGYLDNPEADAASFVAHPDGGLAWLRTGDQGYLDEDGYLFITGRLKELINRAGEKISPREVDEVLLDHPAVAQAASFPVADARLGEDVAAAVVLREGTSATTLELQEFVAKRLAAFKVPAQIVIVDQIPKSAAGKVVRIGLAEKLGVKPRELASAATGGGAKASYQQPKTLLEAGVAWLISDVLNVERVGREDNFFDLGGDSVLAARTLNRIQAEYGVEISLPAFWAAPTPAGLGERLEAAGAGAASNKRGESSHSTADATANATAGATESGVGNTIELVDRSRPLPLSYSQQSFWIQQQLAPDSLAYNGRHAVRLRGKLDVAALRSALRQVVARHEVLRTRFEKSGEEPVQIIQPPVDVPIEIVEISAEAAPGQPARAAELAAAEVRKAFDLTQAPMIRARLIRIAAEDHVLVVVVHHIASDAWSTQILFAELSKLYSAKVTGEVPELADLKVQYADFAAWHRARLETKEPELVEFWKRHLEGSPYTELPADRERGDAASSQGRTIVRPVAPNVAAALRAAGRAARATLSTTLLSAFLVELARWSGQQDLVVGIPVAGRNRVETEGLIGPFLNTLPLRFDLSGNPTFAELLGRVQKAVLDGLEHQEVPFARLASLIPSGRAVGRNPWFSMLFQLRNVPRQEAGYRGLAAEKFEFEHGLSLLDLNLDFVEQDGDLFFELEYDTALFDTERMERFAGHMLTLLESASGDPERRIGELAMLSPSERDRLLAWGKTEAVPDSGILSLDRFEQHAATLADQTALIFEGREVQWGELNRAANQLAHALIERGVGPGEMAGVLTGDSIEAVTAVLGIWKAGGTVLPLNAKMPAEALMFRLDDARPKLVLLGRDMAGSAGDLGENQIALLDEIRSDHSGNPGVEPDPGRLAYVIYTSGSTGKPNGVCIRHGELAEHLNSLAAVYEVTPQDRALQTSAFTFDMWFEEVWTFLAAGASVVLRDRQLWTATEFYETAARLGVTWVGATTAYWREMVSAWAMNPPAVAWSPKFFWVGGDEMRPQDIDAWRRGPVSSARLLNSYGPTEATITATAYELTGEPLTKLPIGRMLPGRTGYILGPNKELLPEGAAGELWLGGAGVAQGYFKRPELTAARFQADPFTGGRMYKTGDLCRWRPDGQIEYLGRIDHQVKIRGFRVEPGELEAVLQRYPGVDDAAVLVERPDVGEPSLIAFAAGLVAEDTETWDEAGMRRFLKERLPEYMIPARIVALAELPMNANGKLDRMALKRLQAAAPRSSGATVTRGAGALETRLLAIWEDLLGTVGVGLDEDFFTLGGHSLLAIRLLARVEKEMGAAQDLASFFASPTVSAQAEALTGLMLQAGGKPNQEVVVPAVDRAQPQPLSSSQQTFWLHQQRDPASVTYNGRAVSLRLKGAVDVAALESAIDQVVARHESLRTRFETRDGQPVQLIEPSVRIRLEITEVEAGSPEARETRMAELAANEVRIPFDLKRGPLVRARLFRLGDEDNVLLVTVHHITSDGWSYVVLESELAELYSAAVAGKPAPLPQPAMQYADFAAWQRAQLEASGEQLYEYWTRQLGDGPPYLDLPADHPRTRQTGAHGRAISRAVPEEVAARIRALSRAGQATQYTVLLASFLVELSRWCGQKDLVIGTPVAGRSHPESESAVGPFLNVIPLRVDTSGDPSFLELVGRVKRVVLEGLSHQELPFADLVTRLKPERQAGRNPWFNILFQILNLPERAVNYHGLTAEPYSFERGISVMELNIDFVERGGQLSFDLEYDASLFEAATMERFASNLLILLESASASPELKLSQLEMLDEAEARELLQLGAGDPLPAPEQDSPRGVVAMFEQQAALHPDAPALQFEGRKLNYAELNASANRLAHALKGRGIEAGAMVGVLTDDSIEAVTAVIGVWKAGCTLLPLNTKVPREGLAFRMDDAQPALLLIGGETPALSEGAEGPAGENSSDVVTLTPRLRIDDAMQAGDSANPSPAHDPARLAYVIYTSGSTGRPNGVAIPHSALEHHMRSMVALCSIATGERALQSSSFTFDAWFEEVFPFLLTGGSVMLRDRKLWSTGEFFQHCAANQITSVGATTAYWREMVSAWASRESQDWCPRRFWVGGDEMRPQDVETYASTPVAAADLFNSYGPTEVTISGTACIVEPGVHERVPIGRPMHGRTAYVLGTHGELLPRGVAGELWMGGEGIAQGYLNRPELTAKRFQPDPFLGGTMYKTGDLVRWRADGQLEYLGRIDHQVKIRGFRVEPGEIDSALQQHPAVGDAAVLVRRPEGGEASLVAFIETDTAVWEEAEVESELRGFLKQRLAEYMIPARFVAMEQLPMNANGKLDRQELGKFEFDDDDASLVEPVSLEGASPVELQLVELWKEILEIPAVGLEQDFFRLGGHSLLAVRLVARVEQEFGGTPNLGAFFEEPTVRAQARGLEPGTSDRQAVAAIPPVDRSKPLPLSYSQQTFWLHQQLKPDSVAYNGPSAALRMRGPVDREALEFALNQVVARHESLRTRFAAGADGEPVQIIEASLHVPLEFSDVSETANPESEAGRIGNEELRKVFDLSRLPLVRARLVRLGDADHVLLLSMHHITSDGWSGEIFLSEIARFYSDRVKGVETELAMPGAQYADFAAWQNEQLQAGEEAKLLAYWATQMDGNPPYLELPSSKGSDREEAPAESSTPAGEDGRIIELPLSRDLSERLAAFSRAERTTPYSTLLAVFLIELSRYCGQEDLVVGTPVAGRPRQELESAIGPFLNTIPLRVDMSGNPTFRQLVQRVRSVVLNGVAHQGLPFVRMVSELAPDRASTRNPWFSILFQFLSMPEFPMQYEGLDVKPFAVEDDRSLLDIGIDFFERDGSYHCKLEYNTSLYSAEMMDRFAANLMTLLESAAQHPESRISELAMLSESEATGLLRLGTAEPLPPLPPEDLHGPLAMFERHSAARPDADAAIFEGRKRSYAELNQDTNRLAHALLARGIEPGSMVGVLTDDSIEVIAAVFGIWKAGCTVLPLTPKLPRDGLAFRVEDAQPVVILTGGATPALDETADDAVARTPRLRITELLAGTTDDLGHPENDAANTGLPAYQRERIAYVIYTSGSTGKPNGVLVSHGVLHDHIRSTILVYSITSDDRALQCSSFTFDAWFEEVLPFLVVGAAVMFRDRRLWDMTEFLEQCAANRITSVGATTAHWREMVSAWASLESPQNWCPRRFLVGGDEMRPQDVETYAITPVAAADLFNSYGPTEVTISGTTCLVQPGRYERVPIGRPLHGRTAYVLGSHGELLPRGVAGELWMGGEGIAQGYLNRPELTAKRFQPDPFLGGTMYKTGDLVRWRADGQLEYLGRIDHQVKIRGFRVEPGEIDAVLQQHPAIRDAAVLVHRAPGQEASLNAFVETDTATWDEAETRAFVRQHLPEYMVPARFMAMDRLPMNANGKLDRQKLAKIEFANDAAQAVQVNLDGASRLELQLVEIWKEILQVPAVGLDQNFFDLGGHSLLAVRLIARLKQELGEAPPLASFFEAPTIEAQAALMRDGRESDTPCLVPIQPKGSRPPLFFVHAHTGLVFYYRFLADELGDDQPFYGVQAQGLDDAEPLLESVEEMASTYIRQIREVQPQGPYYLGGHCWGGRVVYEMARQLEAMDQEVALLVVVDAETPGCYQPPRPGLLQKLQRIGRNLHKHLYNVMRSDPGDRWDYIVLRVVNTVRGEEDPRSIEVDYIFREYSGRVTVFRPTWEIDGGQYADDYGWGRFAKGGVEVHTVTGYDNLLWHPTVPELARKLKDCMDRAMAAQAKEAPKEPARIS